MKASVFRIEALFIALPFTEGARTNVRSVGHYSTELAALLWRCGDAFRESRAANLISAYFTADAGRVARLRGFEPEQIAVPHVTLHALKPYTGRSLEVNVVMQSNILVNGIGRGASTGEGMAHAHEY